MREFLSIALESKICIPQNILPELTLFDNPLSFFPLEQREQREFCAGEAMILRPQVMRYTGVNS